MSAHLPRMPVFPSPEEAGSSRGVQRAQPPGRHSSRLAPGPSPQAPAASADRTRNAIHLGPRTRRVVRAVARVVNPVVLAIAGRRFMPIVGKVHHRGRRTGRLYAAPLGVRPLGDGFVMPLTFSEALPVVPEHPGSGLVRRYLPRHDRNVIGPLVVDGERTLPAFPRYERLFLRLLGIREFLSLARAPAGWTPPAISDQGETS
jgi:hypothetical protein